MSAREDLQRLFTDVYPHVQGGPVAQLLQAMDLTIRGLRKRLESAKGDEVLEVQGAIREMRRFVKRVRQNPSDILASVVRTPGWGG